MIESLHALILRNGNLVRQEVARPATVARYLTTVRNLAEYQVWYVWQGCPHRLTAEGFLALYETGRIPQPMAHDTSVRVSGGEN
jgi:hypothetical protein